MKTASPRKPRRVPWACPSTGQKGVLRTFDKQNKHSGERRTALRAPARQVHNRFRVSVLLRSLDFSFPLHNLIRCSQAIDPLWLQRVLAFPIIFDYIELNHMTLAQPLVKIPPRCARPFLERLGRDQAHNRVELTPSSKSRATAKSRFRRPRHKPLISL